MTRKKRQRQVQRQKFLLAAGLAAVLVAALFFGFFFNRKGKAVHVSSEVRRYTSLVEKYCKESGIGSYSQVLLAIMQQESAGLEADVMQSSESPFNTRYEQVPGSIDDPEYSIQVGAETFAYCLQEADCTSPKDEEGLKLAIQQYNYGNTYASWALETYGGYSMENAQEYAFSMMNTLGWNSYGDPEYVPHVLRYYEIG